MDRGTWGPLTSTVPALTLPAWSSFMTGKNPGGHGIYAFHRMAFDRYDSAGLANAADLRAVRIWDVAAHAGKRVGVINVPPSYPLRPIPDGYLVGCMLTPPGAAVHRSAGGGGELGEYEIDLPPPKNLRRSRSRLPRARARLPARHAAADAAARRGHAARDGGAPDRRASASSSTRPIACSTTSGSTSTPSVPADGPLDDDVRAALLAVYDELDRAVGRLVEAAGPDANVVLLSDHGFGTKPERSVRVNRWLADQGLLRRHAFWTTRRRDRPQGVPRLVARALRHARPHPGEPAEEPSVERGALHRHGGHLGARPRPLPARLRRARRGVRARARPDPQGLARARPTTAGRRVFRSVQRREDLYRGPYVDKAPDLVAVCEPRFGIIFESLRRELRSPELFGPYEELGYTGTHDPAGLYLLAGPAAAALGEHREFPIEAIAPTVLHLLDVPVPEDHEARSWRACCGRSSWRRIRCASRRRSTRRPSAPAGWRSSEDEAHVAEHLRALGYFE